jgi:uncharacterized membrane protein (GlpM family)
VALLALKLGLTPALIGLATLASRRWGPGIGGLLIALPLTSGPVLFFLALDQGPAFAAHATEGSLAGSVAVGAFCLAYAWAGRRFAWWVSFGLACAGYLLVAAGLPPIVADRLVVLVGVALATPVVGLWLLPARVRLPSEATPPWWDLPARMVLGTALVVGITASATVLGPQLSGLLATFPVFVTVLAVFTHRREGASRTVLLVRGVLFGMFGTIAFFIVLRVGLEQVGLAIAFPVGLALAVAIQALSLQALRRV